MIAIKKKCVICGTTKEIRVSKVGHAMWLRGALIQDALPELSVDDREMLMSDICPKCFDNIFKEDSQ